MKMKKRVLGILLSLVMVLGLMIGMSSAAYAETEIYNTLKENETVVNFNGYKWYIIDYNSTNMGGTVELLAADTSFGTSVFSSNGSNDYLSSTVKGLLDAYTTTGSFKDVASAIADTEYGKLYLLSKDQAEYGVKKDVRKINFTGGQCTNGEWWLRSRGWEDGLAAFVWGNSSNNSGDIDVYGFDVRNAIGVRPALTLYLRAVTFDVSTNTFEVSQAQGFNFVANGATFTAKGANDGWETTLTIVAPTLTTYGETGKSEKATLATPIGLNNFNLFTGANVQETNILYYKATKSGTDYIEGDKLDAAPTDPGDYLAKAFLYDTFGPSVSVGYTIDKATIQNVSVSQNGTLTYTGEVQTPEVTAVGTAVNNQEVSFTYSKTQDGPYGNLPTVTNVTDGGTFYYKAAALHHRDATGSFNVTVNKVNVTAPTIESKSYNAQAQKADVTENTRYTIVNEGGTNAGNYDVVLTLNDAVNYKWEDINNAQTESAPKTLTFQITKAMTNTVTVTMEDWTYGETPAVPESTATFGTVAYTYSDAENGTFTDTPPTTAGTWYIKAEVADTDNHVGGGDIKSYTIRKADIHPTVTLEGWTYGENANEPSVDGNLGSGAVTYTYKAKDAADSTYAATAPTEAGEYTVKATVAETDNYNAGEATADFAIAKADIEPSVTLEGWTYGEEANAPSVDGNPGEGEVTYTYAEKDGTEYSETVPTEAGEYTVKATVAETDNYKGGEAEADFTIAKADAVPAAISANHRIYDGTENPLVTVTGEAEGGEMQYALGTATEVTGEYGSAIPTAADIGTYYVWYRVVGDDNHESTDELGPVEVNLDPEHEFGTPDFTLPEQLDVLDESAFEGVPSLKVVDAHSCTSIGRDVFKGTGLKQIRLPKDCEIDAEAFGGQTVCVYAPAGGTTEAFCADDDNLVFVAEAE